MRNTLFATFAAVWLAAVPGTIAAAANGGPGDAGTTGGTLGGGRSSPGYGDTAGAGTTTGNSMGGGTGLGIGSTSVGQTAVQSPVGAPTSASTTPGGPPAANGINMSGTGSSATSDR